MLVSRAVNRYHSPAYLQLFQFKIQSYPKGFDSQWAVGNRHICTISNIHINVIINILIKEAILDKSESSFSSRITLEL